MTILKSPQAARRCRPGAAGYSPWLPMLLRRVREIFTISSSHRARRQLFSTGGAADATLRISRFLDRPHVQLTSAAADHQ